MREEVSTDHGSGDDRKRAVINASIAELFSEWYGPLLRYAFRASGSVTMAEDVVQEAFVDLYRALLDGKTVDNPRGWTLCAVRRSIVDHRRWQERHGGTLLPLEAAGCVPAKPAAPLPPGWEEARLTPLLELLSRREEEVLLLRASGLKYRQIALQLKISMNSVKTLLTRAMRKMRQSGGTSTDQAAGRQFDDIVAETLQ